MDNLRPNKGEIEFLKLAVNRFLDNYEVVMTDKFWTRDCEYRLMCVRDGFSIYSELLNYEPIKWEIEKIRKERPQMEAEIVGEYFKFIRNLISHFPLFNCWDEIYLTKSLINWDRKGQTIDKFMERYKGTQQIKYRFWEPDKKRMTYLDINFPPDYVDDRKYYLKDFMKENEGVRFSFGMMRKVIETQIVR